MTDLEPILPEDSINEKLDKIAKNHNKLKSSIESVESQLSSRVIWDSLQFDAQRAGIVSDSYLFRGSVPSDQLPLIVPSNGIVKYLTMSTASSSSWTLQFIKNGSVEKEFDFNSDGTFIDVESDGLKVSPGDRLSLYCKGSSVDKPFVSLVLRLR